MKKTIIELIQKKYPALSKEKIEPLISDQLFSPFSVQLPKSVLTQAQDAVRRIFEHRSLLSYANSSKISDPGNKSILMSYDFHVTENHKIKLIEINTNASFLALGQLMYEAHQIPHPISDFSMQEIKDNILEELSLNHQKQSPNIAIIDDQPENQKLYIEFLIYNEFFKSVGFRSEICDFRSIPEKCNFIYNRYTDFYFEQPESSHLKKMFNDKSACFSPNPFEYDLLANKKRMIEWSQAGLFREYLPSADELTLENQEAIWNNRKHFFFKPLNSYGSKQSYRGEKISRKMFEKLLGQNFIAQEYVDPSKVEKITPEGKEEIYKYDLRFYVYKDRVQSCLARLYQGQVTNLQTPYGGFAPVIFK